MIDEPDIIRPRIRTTRPREIPEAQEARPLQTHRTPNEERSVRNWISKQAASVVKRKKKITAVAGGFAGGGIGGALAVLAAGTPAETVTDRIEVALNALIAGEMGFAAFFAALVAALAGAYLGSYVRDEEAD